MGITALRSPSQKNPGMHGSGGYNKSYCHFSPTLSYSVTFYIYFPPSMESHKLPMLYWSSGLTCSTENFIIKSEAQRAEYIKGVAIIAPDTSPRGLNVEGEIDSLDFGLSYRGSSNQKYGTAQAP
ncbi:S-formylglutathione hydrolase [Nymphaea thermarum]|nr:S-formylglutathione hydrolase [Nymphaea thermarum]